MTSPQRHCRLILVDRAGGPALFLCMFNESFRLFPLQLQSTFSSMKPYLIAKLNSALVCVAASSHREASDVAIGSGCLSLPLRSSHDFIESTWHSPSHQHTSSGTKSVHLCASLDQCKASYTVKTHHEMKVPR